MILIATKDLYRGRNIGLIPQGDMFEVDEEDAKRLLYRGYARRPDEPRIVYETKVIAPEAPEIEPFAPVADALEPLIPEVQADAAPFRDVPATDEEPASVAPASHSVLPEPDIPAPRMPRRRGRPKGTRSGSRKK